MRRLLQTLSLTSALVMGGLLGTALPASATSCVTPETQAAALAASPGTDTSNWEVKRVCLAGARIKCLPPSGSDPEILCCDPTTPGIPENQACPVVQAAAPLGATTTTETGTLNMQSWIPSDVRACMRTGNCNPDHLVRIGAAFANFLFGLSGAIFLLTFVYGGFLYLTAGGASENVKKAQKMIVEAAIGMMLMFGASTLIRFVYKTVTPPSRCESERSSQGYACQYVAGETAAERAANGGSCLTGLCNLSDQGPNIMCCPLTSSGSAVPAPSAGTASDSGTPASP